MKFLNADRWSLSMTILHNQMSHSHSQSSPDGIFKWRHSMCHVTIPITIYDVCAGLCWVIVKLNRLLLLPACLLAWQPVCQQNTHLKTDDWRNEKFRKKKKKFQFKLNCNKSLSWRQLMFRRFMIAYWDADVRCAFNRAAAVAAAAAVANCESCCDLFGTFWFSWSAGTFDCSIRFVGWLTDWLTDLAGWLVGWLPVVILCAG